MRSRSGQNNEIKKVKFFRTLFIFIAIGIFLIGLNLVNYQGHFWAFYPLMGMALGITMKGIDTFSTSSSRSRTRSRTKKLTSGRTRYTHQPKPLKDTESKETNEEAETLELKELQRRWADEDLV